VCKHPPLAIKISDVSYIYIIFSFFFPLSKGQKPYRKTCARHFDKTWTHTHTHTHTHTRPHARPCEVISSGDFITFSPGGLETVLRASLDGPFALNNSGDYIYMYKDDAVPGLAYPAYIFSPSFFICFRNFRVSSAQSLPQTPILRSRVFPTVYDFTRGVRAIGRPHVPALSPTATGHAR